VGEVQEFLPGNYLRETILSGLFPRIEGVLHFSGTCNSLRVSPTLQEENEEAYEYSY
jgi:hypothetical protein